MQSLENAKDERHILATDIFDVSFDSTISFASCQFMCGNASAAWGGDCELPCCGGIVTYSNASLARSIACWVVAQPQQHPAADFFSKQGRTPRLRPKYFESHHRH